MAKIYKRKDGYWILDYTWHNKRYRKSCGKGIKGKTYAQHLLADLTMKINHKKMGIIEEISAEIFFCNYLDWSEANKSIKSYKRDKGIIKNFFYVIESKNLSQVGTKNIERYKIKRAREVTKSTVNRELNTVFSAFNKAVEWGYLAHNPAKGVKKFKEAKISPRYFDHLEIKRILAAIQDDQRLYSMVFILLNTGMRRDELVHLEWGDIDLRNNKLLITPKLGWSPKDDEARMIPLHTQLKIIFKNLPRKGNLVFDDGYGKFWYNEPSSLSRAFKRVLRRLGIEEASLHTLRHTYASHLVMEGVDLASVQKLLGHSQLPTTMKYAHLAPEHLQKAADKTKKSFGHFLVIQGTQTSNNVQRINQK